MSDEESVMPIRQGSIDGLCGVYSVMNATEVVIGKFHYDRKLKRKASQRRVLYKTLIGYLAKHDLLEEALIWRFDDIDAKGGFIDIAIKSVKKYQNKDYANKPLLIPMMSRWMTIGKSSLNI